MGELLYFLPSLAFQKFNKDINSKVSLHLNSTKLKPFFKISDLSHEV